MREHKECDLNICRTRSENSTYSIRTLSTTNHITYGPEFMIHLLQIDNESLGAKPSYSHAVRITLSSPTRFRVSAQTWKAHVPIK